MAFGQIPFSGGFGQGGGFAAPPQAQPQPQPQPFQNNPFSQPQGQPSMLDAFRQQQQSQPPAFAQAFQRLGIGGNNPAGGQGPGFTGLSGIFQQLFNQGGFQGGAFGGFGGQPAQQPVSFPGQPQPANFAPQFNPTPAPGGGGIQPISGQFPQPILLAPQDGIGQQQQQPFAFPGPAQPATFGQGLGQGGQLGGGQPAAPALNPKFQPGGRFSQGGFRGTGGPAI